MADYLVRALAKEAGVRAFACVTTDSVNEAARRHQTSEVAGVALGRALTGAALMGALLKVKQRLALKFEGAGPLERVIVEGDSYGRVRGYVGQPQADLPRANGQVDLVGAIGRAGLLTVVKDVGMKELYESVVPLAASDFVTDLNDYFAQSEQIATAVQLGERLAEDGTVTLAGGLLIQDIPGKGQAGMVARLKERLQELPPVIDLLHAGNSPEDVLALLFAGMPYDLLEQRPLSFTCDCSWERTRAALLSLGAEEVSHLLETDGQAMVTCHYCHEEYLFDQYELEVILVELGAEG